MTTGTTRRTGRCPRSPDGERRATAGDVDAVVAEAVGAWRSLRSRKDVAALLAATGFFTVPFSMTRRRRRDRHPVILRGAIDCLVQKMTVRYSS
jgi:hypothetical protein